MSNLNSLKIYSADRRKLLMITPNFQISRYSAVAAAAVAFVLASLLRLALVAAAPSFELLPEGSSAAGLLAIADSDFDSAGEVVDSVAGE